MPCGNYIISTEVENKMQSETIAGVTLTKPNSRRKRKAIVNAAKKVFLEQGFEAANMNRISEEANVSKRTIYKHFENKYELFIAIIHNLCDYVAESMSSENQPDNKQLSMEDYLKWLGINFLQNIYKPEQIELYRTVTAEAKTSPEIGIAFFDGPISRSEHIIYDYFVEQTHQKKMVLKQPRIAASQFIGMLKGDMHMKLLFTKRKRVPSLEIEEMVEGTVDLFLNGAAPKN